MTFRFHSPRLIRFLKGSAVAFGFLAAALAAFVALSFACIGWDDAGTDRYDGGAVLRDRDGRVLRVSLGPNDVDCRPYYEADPDDWIVKALVAVEDGTFWEHCGVRPLSMFRALFQNLFWGRRISGASTITMQAVRLIRPHPKTLWWKWKEAVMAVKMERAKDKRWILSQYLNRAPYGSNLVGIEAAAQGWFGKRAKDLGIAEAALLAGMVQAPSRLRPDRGYDAAVKRREYVLSRMRTLGFITGEQQAWAKGVRPVVSRAPRPFRHPYYCDAYLRGLGFASAREARGDITTPLDEDVQTLCETAVNEAAKAGGFAVAAVVTRTSTGETVALACSGDYFSDEAGQVNTALAPRPAGSVLKPILAAQAMDLGILGPDDVLADVPRDYEDYHPANFDGRYRGDVSVRDALVESLNLPFVDLLARVGVARFGATLSSFGFAHVRDPYAQYGLGMAIGNVEVTLAELTAAYARFARGEGVSREAAYLVAEMLAGDERSEASLGHVADVGVSRFAWKTGTSSAYRDAWTVAWNPEYVVGVWCGHLRGGFGDTTVMGAKAAAPVAWRIARALYPQDDGPWFVEPAGAATLRARESEISREGER